MARDRIPNVIELGRRPEPCRYVWVIRTEDENVRMGATWGSLKRTLEEEDGNNPTLRVMDLLIDEVVLITDMESFMEDWRVNYFNTRWDLGLSLEKVDK